MAKEVEPRRGCAPYIWGTFIVVMALAIGGYFLRPKEQGATNLTGAAQPTAASIIGATAAPPIEELVAKKRDLTDAQWDAFAESLKGRRISDWVGTVKDVDQKPFSDLYTMKVDVTEPTGTYAAFDLEVDMAKADALQIDKGRNVTVSGLIRKIECVLTFCPIELDRASYSLK